MRTALLFLCVCAFNALPAFGGDAGRAGRGAVTVSDVTATAYTVAVGTGLRVRLDYSQLKPLPENATATEREFQDFVRDKAAPLAAAEISRVLELKSPPSEPPTVWARCKRKYPGDKTKCAEWHFNSSAPYHCRRSDGVFHAPEYLGVRTTCDPETGECTDDEGAGGGATGADIVIYIKIGSGQCRAQAAHASHCRLDSETGRPTFGFVVVCPRAKSLNDVPGAVTRMLFHEMLHAVFFNTGQKYYWRSPDNVRYSRDEIDSFFAVPPAGAFLSGNEQGKWLREPGALEAARRFYACEDAPGIPMNRADLSHLSPHHMLDDVMSPWLLKRRLGVFGELSGALAESTGWYRVRTTSHIPLGFRAGCDVLKMPCEEFVAKHPGSSHYAPDDQDSYCWPDRLGHGRTHGWLDCRVYGLDRWCDPGSRCVMSSAYPGATPEPECVPATCDGGGSLVLTIDGKPQLCPTGQSVGGRKCPDNSLVCAGLECRGDCSGRGRCVDGRCMCEFGFTGDDCETDLADGLEVPAPADEPAPASNKTCEELGRSLWFRNRDTTCASAKWKGFPCRKNKPVDAERSRETCADAGARLCREEEVARKYPSSKPFGCGKVERDAVWAWAASGPLRVRATSTELGDAGVAAADSTSLAYTLCCADREPDGAVASDRSEL